MAKGETPKSIRASLYIDGKPAEASLKNVGQVTRTLERELQQLTIGTDAWKRKLAEVAQNKKYLREIRDEVNGVGGAFSQLKQELGKVGALAAGYLGFQFVTEQFQNIIQSNAKLSDSLADMRRVTGLTEEGVLALNSSLGKLDTRTSKGGLRDIAVIAGKLGVAKGEILGFVAATDKLVVALGDELGDADKVTTTLGKILNVFDGEVTGDNITRLGNAMVKLANDGVASAGFISDFTQRVSGIAKTAGLSLPATLALGAGIEELGGRSESAATAMQKLFLSIASDTPKAAKIAGVALEDFNEMMRTSPDKALLVYTKGLVANKAAFTDVTKALSDAGEEGARTIETITKLGQNTDFFTGKISDATTAIGGYNEINEAFELKNQTLGAQVEKLGKDFNSLAQNKTLTNFFSWLVQATAATVGWLKENSNAIGNLIKVILVGTAAWLGYKSALVLTSTWQSLVTTYMAAQRVGALLLALAQAKLAGDTGRVAAAQRMLGLSMVATPFGAVLALVAALTAAYVLFTKKVETAAKIQEDLTNIQTEATRKANDEKEAIADVLKALNSENLSREQKLVLVRKLRGMMGEHLKGYTDEEILAGKAKKSIDQYVASLERRTIAEAAQAQLRKLQQRNIELEGKDGSEGVGVGGTLNEGFQAVYGALGLKSQVNRLKGLNKGVSTEEIKANKARIKAINDNYGEMMQQQLATPDDVVTPTGSVTAGSTKDKKGKTASGKTDAQKAAEKAKEAADKLRADLAKIEDDIYQNSLSKWTKELAQIETRYDELRKRANGNKEDLAAIDKLQAAEQKAVEQRITDESVKEAEEASKKITDARLKIFEGTATEYELEYMRTMRHYDDLIALAEQYGLDTVAVKEAQLAALMAVDDKKAGKKTPEQEQKELEDYQQAKNDFLINSATEVSDAVFNIMGNKAKAESQRNLSALQRQRDEELSNVNLTEKQKAEINAKFDQKVREEKKRAFAAEQKAAIAQALVNGALAATKVLAQTGVLSPFALPAIAIATAAQIAMIASQAPPEYAEGGMSDSNPAGYVSKTTLFRNSASGRPFIAGEKGREWIAPNWMLNNPVTADIIGSLESVRQGKRNFAVGGFNGDGGGGSAGSSANDFRRLESMITGFIQAQDKTNSKPTVIVYKDLETFGDNIEKARIRQTG